jgi:hypothetical protein
MWKEKTCLRRKSGSVSAGGKTTKSGFAQINFASTAELIEDNHIYKLPVVSVILAALLDNSFLGWERGNARLTNNHVVKLVGSPLSESVVVRVIGAYSSEFDTSHRSLLTLKRKGVSDKVIAAMLSKATKATASAVSAPSLHDLTYAATNADAEAQRIAA